MGHAVQAGLQLPQRAPRGRLFRNIPTTLFQSSQERHRPSGLGDPLGDFRHQHRRPVGQLPFEFSQPQLPLIGGEVGLVAEQGPPPQPAVEIRNENVTVAGQPGTRLDQGDVGGPLGAEGLVERLAQRSRQLHADWPGHGNDSGHPQVADQPLGQALQGHSPLLGRGLATAQEGQVRQRLRTGQLAQAVEQGFGRDPLHQAGGVRRIDRLGRSQKQVIFPPS